MTLEEIQNSDDPEFNMRFWNKYKVGDIITNSHGGLFFVSRNSDRLKYTLVRMKDKYRKEYLKGLVNLSTELTLTSKLKDL